jgi:hypothetical protein
MKRLSTLFFLTRQRLLGFDVPTSPHFDSESTTEWFRSRLSKASRYVEYGSGGSTYLAASKGVPFICVDSDRFFLRAVKEKVKHAGFLDESTQTYRHANIGLTGPWGYPISFGASSTTRLKMFAKYSDPPPACLSRSFLPDFILIDGRFRVACALKIVQLLGNASGWTIAFDDYVDRPQYHVIEDFAVLEQRIGRMAVFSGTKSVSIEKLTSAIREYEVLSD